jgi:hypothetical protein
MTLLIGVYLMFSVMYILKRFSEMDFMFNLVAMYYENGIFFGTEFESDNSIACLMRIIEKKGSHVTDTLSFGSIGFLKT